MKAISFAALLLVLTLLTALAMSESVYVLWTDVNDPFSASTRSCLEDLSGDAGITFTHLTALGSQWTQMDQVEEAIDAGAGLICVQSCEYGSTSAARALLSPIQDAGIPGLFFGRQIASTMEKTAAILEGYPSSLYVHFDSADIGIQQGQAAGTDLAGSFASFDLNSDGRIAAVVLKGDPQDPEAESRASGAVLSANAILENAGFAPLSWYGSDTPLVLSDPQCMWSAAFARDTVDELLKTYGPDSGQMIELILCGNDDMALGAVNALFHVDWNTDLPGSPAIPVYGVDGTPTAQDFLEKHRMMGTIARSPSGMASSLLSAIQELLTGQEQSYPMARREGRLIFPAWDELR